MRRFIAQSFAGWPYARAEGPIKTEEDPLGPEPPPAFRRTLEAIRYAVEKSTVIVSERADGSVWLIEAGSPPRRIETPEGCRYADFEFDLPRRRVFAVREDHRDRPPTDPKAAIVAVPLDPDGAEKILVEEPDFLSSPRLSPSGDMLAWIAWDHPGMPWDGTKLFVAGVTREGALEATRLAAGETPEAIVQPEWSANGTLHVCSDRTGWWNLYALRGTAMESLAPVEKPRLQRAV